ncbi:serine hydrolase [Paenibacillus sp. GSMTC-2017]|uniref:serine hydrolase n=1 Tax=Paenibacillus sp. GSMTC-2017 TaxID=2794350 RepID=UPI0018D81E48|nr:serine hydrolase [Paenibacillus sp. GSMTC-2017]MBH5316815.1 serine hydrolase [Paenibacillus sp. GSMTC-2017]
MKVVSNKVIIPVLIAGVFMTATVPATASSVQAMPQLYQSAITQNQLQGPVNAQEVQTFVDNFFAREDVKALEIPGATVVIVKDGKVMLQKGYGFANVEKKIAVDPEKTLFRIASVAKVFTAAAVMQLVEQGKIDLESDVQQYFGDIQIKNETGTPLTMKHLLTHTTGYDIVDPPQLNAITYDLTKKVELKDYVEEWMPTVVNKPGEAFKYDNIASLQQGYVVQQVSGTSFDQYMRDNIFKPLGMKNSYFLMSTDLTPHLAVGYDDQNKATPNYNFLPNEMPQGGMVTTGSDMAKFMLAYLNEGEWNGQRILTNHSVQEMGKVHLAIHPKVPNMAYGFEFGYQQLYNGQHVIEKGGAAPGGFSSLMWLLPEHNTGVFVVYNKSGDLRGKLFQAFMDHYYPKKRENEQENTFTLSQQQLKRFEGIYRDSRVSYVITRIRATSDGKLAVENLTGKKIVKPLDPLLFVDEDGGKVAFKEDAGGTIAYLFSGANPVAWVEKLNEAIPFKDVDKQHPYAAYINELHQLGIVKGDFEGMFDPEKTVTRAEFVNQVATWIGMTPSKSPLTFTDISHLPHAGLIQSALEYRFISGMPDGTFEPDRPITRQEAAVIMTNVMLAMGATPIEGSVTGDTADWAVSGVKFISAMKYYGPEVTLSADGTVDYKSKQVLTRQEAAALIYYASRWSY